MAVDDGEHAAMLLDLELNHLREFSVIRPLGHVFARLLQQVPMDPWLSINPGSQLPDWGLRLTIHRPYHAALRPASHCSFQTLTDAG